MTQMDRDEAAAIARAQDGDADAFRLIVERHSRAVYRLAYRMTGNPADAEDVTQEAFVRAYRQLRAFEARSSVSTWLHRITVNCAIDYLRVRRRREVTEPPETLMRMAGDGAQRSLEDLVHAARVGHRVHEALGVLTAHERAAFVLRHYHGCSVREVADRLGVGTSAAKHAVFRAVKKMRAALRPLVEAAPANAVAQCADPPRMCQVKS